MSTVYNKIIQYIDAHIKEDITIAEIAGSAGYSPNHIYKIFKVYSPYPIMEYIRRKKLYFAASEMYSGRKLYDIALDYGYETPAGFYKAFKAVFGCSPSMYKNNVKEGISMMINHVQSIEELDAVLAFAKAFYSDTLPNYGGEDESAPYSRQFWTTEWKYNPGLLLYAKENGQICGFIFGHGAHDKASEVNWELLEASGKKPDKQPDGRGIVTLGGNGVAPEYKNKGIHEALFVEMENRAKKLGHQSIMTGIFDGQEAFFAKLGYTARVLIQSEKYSIDELKAFNNQYYNYEVTATSVYDGYINQIWINASLLDTGLRTKFEQEIGDCWVQIIVNKEF
ncbi:MAG: GNAT family N-acetyltransferase [Firmicutes bacterium]|nr:GNAT family N-acetyltransferase [Bacillota bacterium]